jgi:hypothetical protein
VDPRRFDSLTKRFGTRLSRRRALRAGAGAALGAIALAEAATSFAQDEEETAEATVKDRFISVRTYPYTGPIEAAQAGLKAVIPVMYEQPGFISIHFIAGDQQIHAVLAFLNLDAAISGADALDAWIAEHAQAILSAAPEIRSGPVFLRSELHTGCPCTTDVEDSCNSDRLSCCGTSDVDGGPGVCLTAATTCPGAPEPELEETEEPMVIPTATTTDTSTADTACTGEGCACIAGADEACDDGLQCCGTGELGGAGVCLSDCGSFCTSEGCGCISGTEGACDDGLQCCSTGEPGTIGACFSDCGGGGCTGDGCACISGVPGACDAGLECCGAEPGAEGICQVSCENVGVCPGGEGCDCISGKDGTCDKGLVCCGAGEPGGAGTCENACT